MSNTPGGDSQQPIPTPRQLCIWFPNWPIQRWRHEQETEQNKSIPPEAAIVLWRRDRRRGQVVAACNGIASRRGIRRGMPQGEAETLLAALEAPHRCVACWDPAADRRTLEQLAELATARFSPLVALEPLQPEPWAGQEWHQPQALLLELTHLDKLFGSEQQILAEIQRWLADWQVRGAIADNGGTAWAVAHFATARQTWRIVKPGCCRQALEPLPIDALRLPPETAQQLQRLGIDSIAELLQLPRQGLAGRFDKRLLLRIDQALGHVTEPLPIHRESSEHFAAHELEYPTRDAAILKHRIECLIEPLCAALQTERQGALRVQCRFEFGKEEGLTFSLGLFAPTADAAHLIRLLHGRFDNQRLSASVQRIELSVPFTAPLRQYQGTLLNDSAAEGWTVTETGSGTEIARLIDGLSCRLGNDGVLGVSPTSDPLPENAYRLTPLAGHRRGLGQRFLAADKTARVTRSWQRKRWSQEEPQQAGKQRQKEASPPASDLPSPQSPLRRPLVLLPEPVLLESFELDAQGVPQRLRFAQTERCWRVLRYWGPERIESGWWRGPSIRRDYYRLETDSGQWLWVFRTLGENRWMLHGSFS